VFTGLGNLRLYAGCAFAVVLVFPLPGRGERSGVERERPWWPQFRGPDRDGKSPERNLLRRWPEGGPPLIWSVDGIGRGWSSPVAIRDRLFITGDIGNDLWIQALDLDGRVLWRRRNGAAWKGPYPGARATCTFAEGRLYHLNAHGRLVCLDPADGDELWSVNTLKRFEGDVIRWGLSECLLVYDGRVVATPGGRKALMVAFDARTGDLIWSTPPLMFRRTEEVGGRKVDPPRMDADRAGYASPILVSDGGKRWIAGASGRHVFLVDADTGALVWKKYVSVRWEVIGTMPVLVAPDTVVFSAPDLGAWCVRVQQGADGRPRVEELWRVDTDNCHGGFVVVNNRIFGAGYRLFRGWFCLEGASGRVLHRWRGLKKGSVIAAEGLLYTLAENGVAALLEPMPGGFAVRGQFRLPKGGGSDVWAHPVLCDGRFYVRRHDTLWCFDVRRPAPRR